MFGSSNYTFYQSKFELANLREKVRNYLRLKDRKEAEIQDYLNAFDYFVVNYDKFDGATIVKDLEDLKGIDLDAMVHDYDYLHGANKNFIRKWNADIRYIKNMEANGKGIRVFRFFILTLLGIFFVPYCYIKYKLN